MISLTILTSPDLIICESLEFFKNHITMGNKNCDINISDPEILRHHLTIEILPENKLIIEPGRNIKNYFIDGKITTSKSTVRVKQQIQIGSTTFIVNSYQFELEENIKSLRDKELISLSENKNEKWELIEKIKAILQ